MRATIEADHRWTLTVSMSHHEKQALYYLINKIGKDDRPELEEVRQAMLVALENKK